MSFATEEYNNHLEECIGKIEFLHKEVKNLLTDVKNLKKKTPKVLKVKRKRESVTDGKHVGFKGPVELSDELARFLNVPIGTTLPRSNVTKMIFEFIKNNNLKDVKDGRKFDLSNVNDENAQAFRKLFDLKEGDEIGYFTLQRYLKQHLKSIQNTTVSSIETSNVEEATCEKPKIKRKKHVEESS